MTTKKQLNKKIELLEAKLQVEKHTKKYIHIPQPSLIGIGNFLLTIFFGFLSYFNFKLILKIWNDYNLRYFFKDHEALINHVPKFEELIVLCFLIGGFLLISFTIICLVNLFKKDPLVFKVQDGKYIIDVQSTFEQFKKK